MRRLILPFTLVAVASTSLTACGQKGDLYLPPPATATATPGHPAAQPAHAATTATYPSPASTTLTPFNPAVHQ